MPGKKIKKVKSLDKLLNQSEEIINHSREIRAQGAMLSRQLIMLHRQSAAVIDYSRKIIKNYASFEETTVDGKK